MIKLTRVYKTFFTGTPNELPALNNINLHIKPGDFITVIGSNGAGKSTLLKIISGVETVDTGTIKLAGKDVTNFPEYKRSGDIGRIDQDPMVGTASDMTIEENLAMAYMRGQRRGLLRAITKNRSLIFKSILAETGLGLEQRLQVPVGTLSGGQRQALALVMATITQPKLLLLDEHTAALDPKAAKQIMELTRRLVESKKLTTLMITHNMEQAIKFGNRLIMMHRGKIVLDIDREEKDKLTIPQLIEKFNTTSGTTLDDDRVLLAN
ncbi:ABC transporter ATP-binding protein [Desulfolucanica intricata]|uniref:ABC transporter ATP-binding protein n=1 Tax=Desulfolucanica intricata TaxID=1285191 RepID=UPI00082F17E5|nr:ATP-binding cassette domain-containing protein [Desulfolucanica intricata]